jgi:hypothetical protein
MSLPISTLTGSNTIAQLIYNVNRIKTLAANTASTVANSTFQSALANTNAYIAMKANTSNPIFNGIIGIGISPTRTLDVNGYAQIGSTAEGRLGIGEKLSTGAAHIELGEGRSGSGYAWIDLVGDTTYTDYGLRILRGNSGSNTTSNMWHRGTGDFNFVTQEAAPIIFYTNNTERMRITSGGTFVVGTTAGLTSELIHARRSSGTISTLYNNGSTGDVLRLYHENTAVTAFSIWGVGAQRGFITSPVSSNGLIFGTSSTERMRLAANGNFGIGTSSPNDYGAGFVNLQINSTTGGIIQATYGGTTAIAEILTTSGEGRFGTRTNHPMILKTNNTERMRITAAGKVGIGTSNPLSALHVNGSVSLNQYYEAYLVNAYYDGAWKYLGNGVAWGIGNNFNGAANSLTLATAAVNAGGAAAALTWVPALSISVAGASTFSGNLGVGRGSTGSQLDVYATSGNKVIGNFEAAQGGFSNSVVKILNTLGSSSAYDMLTVQTDSDADAGGPYTLFKIRGDGKLIHGHTSATTFGADGWGSGIQEYDTQGIAIIRSAADPYGGALNLVSSRGSVGSPTIVTSGDRLGGIYFSGYDGGDFNSYGAAIEAQVDGTPGVNDMPGRLLFYTVADGSNTLSERMRLDSSGNLGIGTTPANKFHVNGGITSTSGTAGGSSAAITLYYDTGNDYGVLSTLHNGVSWKPFVVRSQGIIFQTSNDGEAARIDSSGNILIGTSTSDKQLTLYSATDASQGISLRNQSAGTSAASYISMGNDSDALDGQIFLTGSMNTSLAGTRSLNFLSNVGAFGFYRNRLSPVATMVMDTSGNVGIGTSPTTTLDVAGTARATQGMPIASQSANTKTLALTDNGSYVRCSNSTTMTVTIPANATVAFPTGAEMVFFQVGAGNVQFAKAAGVTVNSKDGALFLTGQYSAATLKKIATNTWDLIGDLA